MASGFFAEADAVFVFVDFVEFMVELFPVPADAERFDLVGLEPDERDFLVCGRAGCIVAHDVLEAASCPCAAVVDSRAGKEQRVAVGTREGVSFFFLVPGHLAVVEEFLEVVFGGEIVAELADSVVDEIKSFVFVCPKSF